jgi:hypothetical protein
MCLSRVKSKPTRLKDCVDGVTIAECLKITALEQVVELRPTSRSLASSKSMNQALSPKAAEQDALRESTLKGAERILFAAYRA